MDGDPTALAARVTAKVPAGIRESSPPESGMPFEFLGPKSKDALEESDLEATLLSNLREFLLEPGHGFCREDKRRELGGGE